MNNDEKIKFKQILRSTCLEVLKQRMRVAENAMEQAQEAANNESKSSAGDKYETTRSMGQIERDMNAKQLDEARREWQRVESIRADKINEFFVPGSFACCEGQYYFLSSGLGSIMIEEKKVLFLSSESPLGKLLLNKKAGDKVLFNKTELVLSEIY